MATKRGVRPCHAVGSSAILRVLDVGEPVPVRDVMIRRAVAEDAPGIGAVFDAAVRQGWTFLGDVVQRPLFSPHDWDHLVADHAPPNALLVATDIGRRVIGYTAVHSEDGELFLLFVDPAYARRGVGRALLDAAHDLLRAVGRTEAFLFTEERNGRVRTVYAAAGYRPDGTFRESELHGVPVRELRLAKKL
jgi:GNAT superfamily N-acetyltransferase